MDRIRKLSIYFLNLFNVLIYLLPIVLIFEFCILNTPLVKNIFIENLLEEYVQTPLGFIKLNTVTWTLTTKFIKLIGSCVIILPFYLSLFALRTIFKNYRNGDIFNCVNAYQYRYLGFLLFLDALVAKPIGNMFNVLAVTLSNPKGSRYISISIGTPCFKALFCGAIIIVISWVILEASKLNEEQKLTI